MAIHKLAKADHSDHVMDCRVAKSAPRNDGVVQKAIDATTLCCIIRHREVSEAMDCHVAQNAPRNDDGVQKTIYTTTQDLPRDGE